MSQENVEAAQRALSAFNRGDLAAALEAAHPEIEWVVAREHPDARTLHGREAVAAYVQEWRESLAGLRLDTERVIDAGERVVMIGKVRGVGTGSGADVQVPIAFVSTLRGGRTVRVAEYLDPGEALHALRLEE